MSKETCCKGDAGNAIATIWWTLILSQDFSNGSVIKNPPAVQETKESWVPPLVQEDPLEEEMATHSTILAWEILQTEEPGGLQSIELQRVRHDWACRPTQYFSKPFHKVALMFKNSRPFIYHPTIFFFLLYIFLPSRKQKNNKTLQKSWRLGRLAAKLSLGSLLIYPKIMHLSLIVRDCVVYLVCRL